MSSGRCIQKVFVQVSAYQLLLYLSFKEWEEGLCLDYATLVLLIQNIKSFLLDFNPRWFRDHPSIFIKPWNWLSSAKEIQPKSWSPFCVGTWEMHKENCYEIMQLFLYCDCTWNLVLFRFIRHQKYSFLSLMILPQSFYFFPLICLGLGCKHIWAKTTFCCWPQ